MAEGPPSLMVGGSKETVGHPASRDHYRGSDLAKRAFLSAYGSAPMQG